MRQAFAALFLVLGMVWAGVASAQTVFVQIEAYRDQPGAESSAREYAENISNVNGFRFTTGRFVVALGPYDLETASRVLRDLRAQSLIPADSYLVDRSAYIAQFFPLGGNALNARVSADPQTPVAQPETQEETAEETVIEQPQVATPTPAPVLPEETRREALRSEAELSRQAKFNLQIALQWFGYYSGRIDAAFGPGTRGSMSAWQRDKGYEETGVLTTRQRAELIQEYETVLASIGLERIRDDRAGIEMELPLAMVGFDRHDPPFAHYEERNGSGVKVLLISQSGDENALIGLYDIMQTLKIVPLEGERERRSGRFTLTGQNSSIKSYTYAVHDRGEIKGFTLIWPTATADDKRYDVVLKAMRDSFTPLPGVVLPDTLGAGTLEQSRDLISGLEIRRPDRSLTGFYINNQGAVLTSDSVTQGCSRVTLDEIYDADVVATDASLGLALLRPSGALAPIDFARFQPAIPRIQSEIAVSGYSFGGMLGAPTLTFGTLEDIRGLQGEDTVKRLALKAAEGDAGGPVFDGTGAVVGMLLPNEKDTGRQLPADVSFATNTEAIAGFLSAHGLAAAASGRGTQMAPEDLTRQAANLTVLVSCWGE